MTAVEEKKRHGNHIAWTLAAIASLAAVDEEDVLLAIALWLRLAPEAARGLVYARPIEPASPAFDVTGTSTYRWSQEHLTYVRRDGAAVDPAAVKQNVNTFARDAADELETLTRRMTTGEIAIEEWQSAAAAQVKAIHLAVDLVAQGGVRAYEPSDVIRIVEGVDFQLRRLLDFSRSLDDLSSFNVRLSDDAAIARARLYGASARVTYEASIARSWFELAGTGVAVEQLNVLSEEVDHCGPNRKTGTPGCLEETERGWVPLGDLSLPGQRSCNVNCYCRVEYRKKFDETLN